MNVEHGTFDALVFSLTGGAGPEASIFRRILHKRFLLQPKRIMTECFL